MDSNTDRIEVYIDSFPASFYKICLAERPNFPIPQRQHEAVEVLGRLGSLHQHFSYDDMQVEFTFNYLEDVLDFKSFKQQMSNIRHWLNEGTRLELSDEPELYYEMKHVVFGDVLNDMIEYGEFTVTITLSPFGRVHEDAPLTLTATSGQINTTIYNDSIEDSYPLIIVTGSGSVTLTVNSTRFELTSVTNPLYIDSQKMLVYEMLNNVPRETPQKALAYVYPILVPEINTISATGVTKLEIYRNMMR